MVSNKLVLLLFVEGFVQSVLSACQQDGQQCQYSFECCSNNCTEYVCTNQKLNYLITTNSTTTKRSTTTPATTKTQVTTTVPTTAAPTTTTTTKKKRTTTKRTSTTPHTTTTKAPTTKVQTSTTQATTTTAASRICKKAQSSCEYEEDCCSKICEPINDCNASYCDNQCSGNYSRTCNKTLGEFCDRNEECCADQFCIPTITVLNKQSKCSNSCVDSSGTCTKTDQCCEGTRCYRKKCKNPVCGFLGSSCSTFYDCCAGPCVANKCVHCGNVRYNCTHNSDCCSDLYCSSGTCII